MNIEALRFFLKLYELRNLSEAADATGISPSAASRLLGKLREMFGDELKQLMQRVSVLLLRAVY